MNALNLKRKLIFIILISIFFIGARGIVFSSALEDLEINETHFSEEIKISQLSDFVIEAGYKFKASLLEDTFNGNYDLPKVKFSAIISNMETHDIILQYGDVYSNVQASEFKYLLNRPNFRNNPDILSYDRTIQNIKLNLFEKLEFYKKAYPKNSPYLQPRIQERNRELAREPRLISIIGTDEYHLTYAFNNFSNVRFVEGLSEVMNYQYFVNSIGGEFYIEYGQFDLPDFYSENSNLNYKSIVFAGVYPSQNTEYVVILRFQYEITNSLIR
ncbi:MAG: hypothetical protein FWE02_05915 [Defluviitaleaceae bacterium]|nr:hypothetical protein [Defluviitaleaceae bacterium]